MKSLKKNLTNYYELIKEKIDDILYDSKYYFDCVIDPIRYRTTRRYHVVDTKLKPGYYDKDTIILHSMFSILVDFVEIEKAWLNTWCDGGKYNKTSWIKRKFGRFRSPEDGLAYLTWEIEQTMLSQAEAAKEIFELYNWWKNIRPNRKDPFELACYDKHFDNNEDWFLTSQQFTTEQRKCLDDANKYEEDQYNEDNEMLMRIIKIRNCMWT